MENFKFLISRSCMELDSKTSRAMHVHSYRDHHLLGRGLPVLLLDKFLPFYL
jgi:hypothetical protein